MRMLMLILPLVASAPAFAQTAPVVGPPAPEVILPAEKPLPEHFVRNAERVEAIFQVLNLVDAAETMDCLHRHVCHEGNPIFGRNPSDARLWGSKIGFGALHYLLFQHLMKTNPKAGSTFAGISLLLQGTVVGLNARFAFK